MAINIFEPTLEVQHPTFDYNRLQIQGTFPRNQRIPTDMFPTYSVIAGIHNDKQEGKVATFTEDNRLRVDSAGGGSSGGGLVATQSFETQTDPKVLVIHSPMVVSRVLSVYFSCVMDTPAVVTDRNDWYTLWFGPRDLSAPRAKLGMASLMAGENVANPMKWYADFNHEFTNPLDVCAIIGLAEGSELTLYGQTSMPGSGEVMLCVNYI